MGLLSFSGFCGLLFLFSRSLSLSLLFLLGFISSFPIVSSASVSQAILGFREFRFSPFDFPLVV